MRFKLSPTVIRVIISERSDRAIVDLTIAILRNQSSIFLKRAQTSLVGGTRCTRPQESHRRREGFALHRGSYFVLKPLASEHIELHAPPNTGDIKGTTRVAGPIGFSADRISILYYTKSSSPFLSLCPSFLCLSLLFSFLLSNPKPRWSSLTEGNHPAKRGGGVRRKGGADFRPCACLCERPLAGHPIPSFRMVGINRREMERNGPIRRIHRRPSLHPPRKL